MAFKRHSQLRSYPGKTRSWDSHGIAARRWLPRATNALHSFRNLNALHSSHCGRAEEFWISDVLVEMVCRRTQLKGDLELKGVPAS